MSARLLAGTALLALACLAGAAVAQNNAPVVRQTAFPPLESLQATRERPLFSPTRRPPSEEATPEAPPIIESASLPFELTGVATGSEVRVAILRNKSTNDEVHVREGDSVAPWTIESVGNRYVILRGEGKRVRLWLFDDSKRPGVHVESVGGEESDRVAEQPAGKVDEELVPSEAPQFRPPAEVPEVAKPVRQPPPALRRRMPLRQAPLRQPRARRVPGRNQPL